MGRRMKATTPRKNSTTNSTIGVIGCRIAQAEMFFTKSPALLSDAGFTASPTCRNAPAVATTRSFASIAIRDGDAILDDAGDVDGAALDLALRIDDEHVAALIVGEHGGLRQHDSLRIAHDDFRARERARAANSHRVSRKLEPFPGGFADR